MDATIYTLRVTDANGCTDADQATVIPAVANAGPDKSVCQGSTGIQIGSAPIASANITYAWTLNNGSSAASTLSCTTCAQPIANPGATTAYVLTMTVLRKDNTTCTTNDTVTITPVAAPNNLINFAHNDTTLCQGVIANLGAPTGAGTGFTYSWTPGQYLSNTAFYNPNFNPGSVPVACDVTYLVTASKLGCSFTDEVKVTVINQGITYENETKCGPLWIHQQQGTGNCATASYSWSVLSGTGTVVQTGNNGASAYLSSPVGTTTFRRTTTVNGVSCTADVSVTTCGGGGCDFDLVTLAAQGCPKVFGGPAASFRLGTTVADTSDYNFSWSPAGMVDNPTAAVVTVTSGANAVITCTIINKFIPSITCSESIEVNDPAWTLPGFTIPDENICYNTATTIGIAPVGGLSFQWAPATGLNDSSLSNPMATLTSSQTYVVTATETASGCKITDTMTAVVVPVAAAAGNDRTVCNGATVTLGSAPPPGTSFIYSWQPAGAAWTNGTGPGDPQPQVLFASSNQTFTLTVSDPLSGCSSIDSVTLSSTVSAGEYAGEGDTVCPGAAIQLGRAAEPFATYQWLLADGSPASGLSCATCAAPMLTAPDVTTAYKVQVSYPGCSQPIEDTVTVTILPVPVFDLVDQGYCPAAPLAIGFGSAGNPAAPSGAVSYQWLPVSNLSSASLANPTTTTSVVMDYTIKVTYTNGCTRTDTITITPDAIADAGPDKTICLGESTMIGTPDVAGTSYAWSGGPFVGASNVAQPAVNPTDTATYIVSVTSGSCTITDSVVVKVNIPADFNIDGSTTVCESGSVILGADVVAANTTWLWVPATGVANPSSPVTSITPTDTTTYRLIQTNTMTGCSNYKDVIVVVRSNPISSVTAADTSLCAGTSVPLSLVVTPVGSYQYVWTPPVGLSDAFIANPVVTTSFDRSYAVTVTDNSSGCQRIDTAEVTIKPEEACYPPVTLSGNVFRDGNGLQDATVNITTPMAIPSGLYVSLLDTAGSVVNTVAVTAGGTYDFGITPPGTYRIVLHQNPAGSATQALPAGWINTGENLNAGVGSDAAANGILATVTVQAVNVINANFGIQQPPVSDPKSYTIDQPTVNQVIPLDGTHISTGPGTGTPDQLTGSDGEDGLLNGSTLNRSLVIAAVPTNGELWYNGAPVVAGQKISNYNPALLSFRATGSGYLSATFQYAYLDSAGMESLPVSYTLQWSTPLPLSLLSFEAAKKGTAALLSWQTAEEEEIDHFRVERSSDGMAWTATDHVKAAGSGGHRYQSTDARPLAGINYYRLALVTTNGNYRLGPVRRLDFGNSIGTVTVVPNPARNTAAVVFSQPTAETLTLRLVNSLGQVTATYTIPAGSSRYPLRLEGMVRGMYHLSVEGSTRVHLKLVIQ